MSPEPLSPASSFSIPRRTSPEEKALVVAKVIFLLFLVTGIFFVVSVFKNFPRSVSYFLGTTCLLSFLVVLGISQRGRGESDAVVRIPLQSLSRPSTMGAPVTPGGSFNRDGSETYIGRLLDDSDDDA